MSVETTIVIPAYNESARLAAGYARLSDTLDTMGPERTEVVIVDDGSRDDTMAVAGRVYGHLPHWRVVQQPVNRGKGAAVRLGISVAAGARVLATDADLSIRPRHFPALVAALDDCDIAAGSRVNNDHSGYNSLVRTAAARTFNRLVRHYTGTALRDTQCGAKGYRLGPARVLGLYGFYDRFVYDAEMLFLASRLGLVVHPIEVTWDDIAGSSVHLGRDSIQMFKDLRSFARTPYENPVVELTPDVELDRVSELARQARLVGLALARGTDDAVLVLGRDGAPGGAGVAQALGGRLRTARIDELRGRSFEAV